MSQWPGLPACLLKGWSMWHVFILSCWLLGSVWMTMVHVCMCLSGEEWGEEIQFWGNWAGVGTFLLHFVLGYMTVSTQPHNAARLLPHSLASESQFFYILLLFPLFYCPAKLRCYSRVSTCQALRLSWCLLLTQSHGPCSLETQRDKSKEGTHTTGLPTLSLRDPESESLRICRKQWKPLPLKLVLAGKVSLPALGVFLVSKGTPTSSENLGLRQLLLGGLQWWEVSLSTQTDHTLCT